VRRILTFDGGGVRGLWSACVLAALEQRLARPVRDVVETVAGTSIGALLACAVAGGLPAAELVARCRRDAARIFPRPWPWAGALRPKYDPAPLRAVLVELFGSAVFGTLPRRVLVPVYDVATHDALVLDSTRAAHAGLPIVDVCLASAAAPTFFPAVPLTIAARTVVGVDGGLAANNPALVAWAAEDARHPMTRSVLVSIGTGRRCRSVSAAVAQRAGAVAWLRRDLVGAMLAGPADLVDDACRHVVAPGRYFRLQTTLTLASDAMDDASAANLARLEAEARAYLWERGGDLVLDLAADALVSAGREAAA